MPEQRRLDRVLEPGYLDGLADRPVEEVSALKAECTELETEVSFVRRLAQGRIDILNTAVTSPGLPDVEKLIAASQLDNAQTRFGTISDNLSLAQQQQTLAKTVELAQIIEPAVGHKTTARSRRNSILVGLLIGLIAGAIAAIVVDTRARHTRPA